MKTKRKWLKRGIRAFIIIFVLMNVSALFHAYNFTHFTAGTRTKTADPGKLTTAEKIGTLLFGIRNPRPTNHAVPAFPYETVRLKSNTEIECWRIPADSALGTVILFHGFGGDKSSLLDKAAIFRASGYHTFLVDFMGSGGSEGNTTTIGYREAEQVKTCFRYIKKSGEKNIYLFGTSMGAVAIMKSIDDYGLQPRGIMLECPFGSMYQTVCARFRIMKAPAFPMAGLLVFWGGLLHGFWGFGHNPTAYARNIYCNTLLLYGGADVKVSREEIESIYKNLPGKKKLKIYKRAGHENYLLQYKQEWTKDTQQFLAQE